MQLNERRLGLQAVVAQTLNNYVCDTAGYGEFKWPCLSRICLGSSRAKEITRLIQARRGSSRRNSVSSGLRSSRVDCERQGAIPRLYAARQDISRLRHINVALEKVSLLSTTRTMGFFALTEIPQSPHTNTLLIHIVVPSAQELQHPQDDPTLQLLLPKSGPRLVEAERAAVLIWTGKRLLLAGISDILSRCMQYSQGTAMAEDEIQGAPHFVWRPHGDRRTHGDHSLVSIQLPQSSVACQQWIQARELDTENRTWDEALLERLGKLHERLLAGRLLPVERGIAYEPWGTVYDRVVPAA